MTDMNVKTSITLTLSLFGDDFDPKRLDEMVGVPNTSWHKKNDIIPHRPLLRRKETNWSLSTGKIETLFFTEVSDLFIDMISGKEPIINKFKGDEGIGTKFYIIIEVDNKATPELFFKREFLELTSLLSAEIDVDFYLME